MEKTKWPGAAEQEVYSPSHTTPVFTVDSFRNLVDVFVRKLTELNKTTPFNAIAGCGNSGVPLCAALSYRMGIPIITVRKPGEQTVALSSDVNGAMMCGSYVVVDDLIGSGGTCRRMMNAIHERSGGHTKPAAVMLYNSTQETDITWSTFRWKEGITIPIIGMRPEDWTQLKTGAEPTVARQRGKTLRFDARLEAQLPDISIPPPPYPATGYVVVKSRRDKPVKFTAPEWIRKQKYEVSNIKPPRNAR